MLKVIDNDASSLLQLPPHRSQDSLPCETDTFGFSLGTSIRLTIGGVGMRNLAVLYGILLHSSSSGAPIWIRSHTFCTRATLLGNAGR